MDVQSLIAADKASASPNQTMISSPELEDIASEASSQNDKLDELVDLFKKLVDLLKPTSQPVTSEGGVPGDTSLNQTNLPKANYMNRPMGGIGISSNRSFVNIISQ